MPKAVYDGKWIMTSRLEKDPGRIEYFIGSVNVATVTWRKSGGNFLLINTPDAYMQVHPNVSDAMKEMHKMLKRPPDFLTAKSAGVDSNG